MIFFVKKFNKIIIYTGSISSVLLLFFLVHILENKWSNDSIDGDNFFEEFDLIEESEAEEVIQEKEDILDNEAINNETGETKEYINNDEEDIAKQPQIYPLTKSAEKKDVLKKYSSSMTKYGLTFYPPDQYKVDKRGRMVCIHDDDKPAISNQNKPVHKDMECCLDPDEIPNPYCYYSREKYGKLLDDFKRKKDKMLKKHHEGKGL